MTITQEQCNLLAAHGFKWCLPGPVTDRVQARYIAAVTPTGDGRGFRVTFTDDPVTVYDWCEAPVVTEIDWRDDPVAKWIFVHVPTVRYSARRTRPTR